MDTWLALGGNTSVPKGATPCGGEAKVALPVGAAAGEPEQVLVAAQRRVMVVGAGGIGRAASM